MVLHCWEQGLHEAHLGLRSCHGRKNIFLPKHWASPIRWRLKTMLQNNWWFHQMYRELEAEMSVLLYKQSRCAERETVKYMNYRLSERLSEDLKFLENLLYNSKMVCKAVMLNLWLAFLARNNCRLPNQPYHRLASSAHIKNLCYPRKTSPPSSETWGMCSWWPLHPQSVVSYHNHSKTKISIKCNTITEQLQFNLGLEKEAHHYSSWNH